MAANRTNRKLAKMLFFILAASGGSTAQDEFDIAVCQANVDKFARDKCLESVGAAPPAKPNGSRGTTGSGWIDEAESHIAGASAYCKSHIERLSRYDFEWTDGWLELKFSRFLQSKTPGAFIYLGDKIKFQNGYGAWQWHTYSCEYSPETKSVIEVMAAPGRLD